MILKLKNQPLIRFKQQKGYLSDIQVFNPHLLPEALKVSNGLGLENWLRARSIDTSRSNARLLLKLLGESLDDLTIVTNNHALNLTDCYWIADEDDNHLFEDYSLYRKATNKQVFSTTLSGAIQKLKPCLNSETTNIGSYEKAWLKDSENWLLLKKGTPLNHYAELFTYKLGLYLGFKMANYRYDATNQVIATSNFTNENRMLEHYASYKYAFKQQEIEDTVIANNFKSISQSLYEDYTNILLLDAIVSNFDRHEYNFGIIKSTETCEVLGLAPNFDNNLALEHLSDYLLDDYLNNFGILPHQQVSIHRLTKSVLLSLDATIKAELNLNPDTAKILNHLENILVKLHETERL